MSDLWVICAETDLQGDRQAEPRAAAAAASSAELTSSPGTTGTPADG